jgi:hypothetical protein
MLGTDKSRGDCLEMICADFLEGANHEWPDPMIVRISRTVFLPRLDLCETHVRNGRREVVLLSEYRF